MKSAEDRKTELLVAIYWAIKEAEAGLYETPILEGIYKYDETECDGFCLADDIVNAIGFQPQIERKTG